MKLLKYKSIKAIIFFALIMIISIGEVSYSKDDGYFSDVKDSHWAKDHIYKLHDLGIINGRPTADGKIVFGIGEKITNAEFITMLVKLLGTENSQDVGVPFVDLQPKHWHYKYIQRAIDEGIIKIEDFTQGEELRFNPDNPIQRKDMAKMIVRAMGYDYLAKQFQSSKVQFEDVTNLRGYIKVAENLGIISGINETKFAPDESATREQAITMIARMNKILNNKLDTFHGFYAISSFSQAEKISGFDSIGFGWSRLEYDKNDEKIALSTINNGESDFYLPDGYYEVNIDGESMKGPYNMALENDAKKYLMIYADDNIIKKKDSEMKSQGLLTKLLNDEENQSTIISQIAESLQSIGENPSIEFDGVIIDFEGLLEDKNMDIGAIGQEDHSKDNTDMEDKYKIVIKEKYSLFLRRLNKKLETIDKDLIVCVPPLKYYDGYDYQAIGEIADKIILMAHDFNPKKIDSEDVINNKGRFPLAPMKDVYEAVKGALDNGISKDKLILQINLYKEFWELDQETWKSSYGSFYDIEKILNSDEIYESGFDQEYQAPYIFIKDNEGKFKKIVWYEDARSVRSKLNLAKHFGLKGISIWRLGLVGDSSHNNINNEEKNYNFDVWKEVQKAKQ